MATHVAHLRGGELYLSESLETFFDYELFVLNWMCVAVRCSKTRFLTKSELPGKHNGNSKTQNLSKVTLLNRGKKREHTRGQRMRGATRRSLRYWGEMDEHEVRWNMGKLGSLDLVCFSG